MEKLEHIIPSKEDVFEVKEMAPNVYKIKHKKVSATVRLLSGNSELNNLELIRIPEYYNTEFRKIIGYAYTELTSRYKPLKSKTDNTNKLFKD